MIRVAVAGASGNMGATTCEAVDEAEDLQLSGRADPALGTELAEVLGDADVVVDFTTPDAAAGNVRACIDAGVHVVVGTTGWELEPLRAAASAAAGNANVFVAPNFAIGAVLMMELSKRVAMHMPDCEITEFHRKEKLDAPSGTAKLTAEGIREAGGEVNAIHSVRLPGLVAHQEVIFGGEGQTLTIRHDSMDRQSFMPGVLLAVRRVADLADPFTVGLDKLLWPPAMSWQAHEELPDQRQSLVGVADEGEEVVLIRAISRKPYRCPHCHQEVPIGSEHVVVRYSHPARRVKHTHWHRACVDDGLRYSLRQLRPIPAAKSTEAALDRRYSR